MGEVAEAVPPEIPSMVRLVSQEVIDRYAAASGDYNPIHVDPEYARGTPFGGTIAHGMLVLAYISEAMTAAFGRRWWGGGGAAAARAPPLLRLRQPEPPWAGHAVPHRGGGGGGRVHAGAPSP